MSEIKDGGPAFPDGSQNQWGHPVHTGMTLRDYFAAKAMQEFVGALTPEEGAPIAYWWADAMLKARGQE